MAVFGGVDTHGSTRHVAAIDAAGRLLGDAEFAATGPATRRCRPGPAPGRRAGFRVDPTRLLEPTVATKAALRSEAALAHPAGISPLPAGSGRSDRHRLNRGGARGANAAIHRLVLCRMRYRAPTRAYVARRTAQGSSKKEVMRCLQRYVVREVHTALLADFEHLTAAARRR